MKFSNMIDSGYFMYMAEASGMDNLVNTREAKINAVIKDLKQYDYQTLATAPDTILNYVCDCHNIIPTDKEITKIEREINK